MIDFLNDLTLLIAQLGPSPSGEGGTGTTATDDSGGGLFGNLLLFAPAILGVMLVYMLLAGRPQQKQQAKAQALLDSIKRNDRVLTAGGILGTVVNKDDTYMTIRVDDATKTKLQVLNASIVRVVKDESEATAT